MEERMPVRNPQMAGKFYPGHADDLRRVVAECMPAAPESAATINPHMVMLPHAGYAYCGRVIGQTLARVRLPDTLLLLGPNHTGQGSPLAVWPDGPWKTPLGPVETDAELTARLLESGGGFVPDAEAHAREHSLEVLLPFLQTLRPNLRIAAAAISVQDPAALRAAGEALGAVLLQYAREGAPVSMVVSSDMHHFADQETTLKLDGMALARLLGMDPEGLLRTVDQYRISMCGVRPVVLALYACRTLGATRSELVRHATSAEITGDAERVVGYAGAFFYE